MDLQYLKKLIKIVNESGIQEVEIEEEGTKIRISSKNNMPMMVQMPYAPQYTPTSGEHLIVDMNASRAAQNAASSGSAEPILVNAQTSKSIHEIRSPIVGTFYRAPAPDAESYVQVGQTVSKGTVLCIIEAMKLMNEIESDVDGKLVKILVEDQHPVEYNQTLFLIEEA